MVILYEQHTHTIHHADIPKVLHLIGYNEFHHGNQRVYFLFVKDDTLLQLLPRGLFFCAKTHTYTHTFFHCITLEKANLLLNTSVVVIMFGSYKTVSTR